MEKICTKCGILKRIDDFYLFRNPIGKRKPTSACKSCYLAKGAAYRRTKVFKNLSLDEQIFTIRLRIKKLETKLEKLTQKR